MFVAGLICIFRTLTSKYLSWISLQVIIIIKYDNYASRPHAQEVVETSLTKSGGPEGRLGVPYCQDSTGHQMVSQLGRQSVSQSVQQTGQWWHWTSRSWRYDAWKYSCCCPEKKEKKTFIDPMGNLQKGERTVAQRWKNPSLPATHLDKSRC